MDEDVFEEIEDWDDFDMDAWEKSHDARGERVTPERERYQARGPARLDPLRRPDWLAEKRERTRAKRLITGPYGIGLSGGMGLRPTYEGCAQECWMHPGLLSIKRLVWLTYLATHGPATTSELGSVLGMTAAKTYGTLLGLKWTGLVRERPEVWIGPKTRPGPNGRLWSLGDDTRKYLFRAALVTRRILYGHCFIQPLRNDVNSDPIRALRRHGESLFLRPASLVIARELRGLEPRTLPYLWEYTGSQPGVVKHYVEAWGRRGWVEVVGRSREVRGGCRSSRTYLFTSTGNLALARHVDVMRRVGRVSGYRAGVGDLDFPEVGE